MGTKLHLVWIHIFRIQSPCIVLPRVMDNLISPMSRITGYFSGVPGFLLDLERTLSSGYSGQFGKWIGTIQLDKIWALLQEQEKICRELGNSGELSITLGNQALLLQDWGDRDEGMIYLKEVEEICRRLGDKASLVSGLRNQANILDSKSRRIWLCICGTEGV